MRRINTEPTTAAAHNIDGIHPHPESHRLMLATDQAVTRALRRVGGEAWQDGARSGQRIDPRRLPFLPYPDSRVFSRVHAEQHGNPRAGLFALIDSSGSMGSSCTANGITMTRRAAARAMACGFAAAAKRSGIGFTAAHHGVGSDNGYARGAQGAARLGANAMRLDVHRTANTILRGPNYGDNWDAVAVWHTINSVAMPAQHTLFVLICDGEPTINPSRHTKIAEACIRRLESAGHRFAFAYIGTESQESFDACYRDWGASRVMNCTKDLSQLTNGIVAAMRSIL